MSAPRRNLEIKVRVADLGEVELRALDIGARDEGTFADVDVYFQVPRGRLKLRRSGGQPHGTLIAYDRPDAAVSRFSDYHLARVEDPVTVQEILAAALGVRGTVVKERHLLIYGATRIHLDRVDGLGEFVELETVIGDQSDEDAAAEHAYVLQLLGLTAHEIVPVSYADLLR